MTLTRRLGGFVTLCTLWLRGTAQSCSAKCVITLGGVNHRWTTKSATATVTAATVVEIVNTDLDTTRTSTIFNDDVELPTSTNSDGTVTQVVTYTYKGEVSTTEMYACLSFMAM